MSTLTTNRVVVEEGSLSLEFVLAIPLILVLILGMLELGNYLFWSVSLDSGAQQVVRLVQSSPRSSSTQSVTNTQARTTFLNVIPSFKNKDSLKVKLSSGTASTKSYTHHLPQTRTDDAFERNSQVRFIETVISVSYSYKPLTFLGSIFCEEDGSIHLEKSVSVNQSLKVKDWAKIW